MTELFSLATDLEIYQFTQPRKSKPSLRHLFESVTEFLHLVGYNKYIEASQHKKLTLASFSHYYINISCKTTAYTELLTLQPISKHTNPHTQGHCSLAIVLTKLPVLS